MSGYVETPREPLRPVVATPAALDECLAALAAGTGPVAFDAERAHGHRYWPKAYLFQIRREGSGTWLIDPIAFEQGGRTDLGSLVDVCGDVAWVVHAASQDLPCMREAGIYPDWLFDTELGARVLGEPSVSLGVLLEDKLGIRLRKAHSAQNWATRPLPEDWLVYAALDVDYLLELATVVEDELIAAGRIEWADEEFAATLEQFREAPPPRKDPWRRTSGITTLRTPRQLAVARALWEERDRIARDRDRPPSHILHDTAIVEIAGSVTPEGPLPDWSVISSLGSMRRRSAMRYRTNWVRAIAAVSSLSAKQYPARRAPSEGIPHPKNWDRIRPSAAALWRKVRPEVDELACELLLQPSIIAPPSVLQEVVFNHTDPATDFAEELRSSGAREWQIEFLAPLLQGAAQRS